MILAPRALGRVPPRPASDLGRGEGPLVVRYEDVAQDGRLGLRPISHGIGSAVWRALLSKDPLAGRLLADGIVPILSRLVLVAGGGPISVSAACRAIGTFAFRRSVDGRGEPRISVDMWAEVEGPVGRTWPPAPERAGERIPLGAVYGEHVLTRPFGPPEARKVGELPGLTVEERPWAEPAGLEQLPEGGRWLGEERPDPDVVFGLGHTDSNQHVNSLVYPALLEQAALRALAPLGPVGDLFADFAELRFRKPFFAGETCRLVVRPFERGEAVGVVARFVPPDEDRPGRAHAYAVIELAR